MKVDPRFLTAQGAEIFTGNELLVKGALETEGGVHLLGGYPGSPVAGYFDTLAALKDLLNEKGIRAAIANNEALGAAMLNGTQGLPCRGMIVMKSVGVHVAADALALGNLAGAHVDGGAIVVYGDDPWSDSTQVPADSRYISKHLHIPVIEPATPQEVKDYVDMSFKLSRWSELYAGYVLTTNLADGGGTVQCRPNQYPTLNTLAKVELESAAIDLNKRVLLPPKTWWQEENLADRFGRCIQASRKLGFNKIHYPASTRKTVGFATSGMAHSYLVHALFEMGLLGEYPILKFGVSYPIDTQLLSDFTQMCERIVVIEERRGFLEEQITQALVKERQIKPAGPGSRVPVAEVWGKTFPAGLKGIPDIKGLHPSMLITRLVPLLKLLNGSRTQMTVPAWLSGSGETPAPLDSLDREIQTIDATAQTSTDVSGLPTRLASFCPGCPHRDSSSVCLDIQKRFKDPAYMGRKHQRGPVDLIFHGDTGCYTMLMFPPNTSLMHDYSGMGLGAGTGSGVDPFITNKQAVFMGDSTFFHSGQIAISQAIKLCQDITFIILDNRTTAMTGHQPTPGVEYDVLGNPTPVQDIEEVVRGIAAGTAVPVIRTDPSARHEYTELLEQTFLMDGVKVIIADKECGITSLRRRRRLERAELKRRGYLKAWEHLNVNQDICRFCLSCSEMTGCPGLKHTDTDYGRKMDTDLSWCVGDGACERIGACSAFEYVTIKRKRPAKSKVPELGLDSIPEPEKRPVEDLWRCCLVGVGGMGIGLATSIVVRAGHNQGYEVVFLDKKGLAIRNGGVISQVIFNVAKKPVTAIIPFGKADLLLGIDVLEAARALDPRGRTRIASKQRTAAVINTDKIATIQGLMGREDFDPAQIEKLIESHTRADDFLARDISRICEKYLGSKLYANIMMLGFAFQKGLIPVSMHSMAWAIKDTIRADFRKNLYAFNMGRKLVVQPDLFQGPPKRDDWRDLLEEKCRWTIRRYRGGAKLAQQLKELVATLIDHLKEVPEPLKRAIVVRMYDCMRWGGLEYAIRYAKGVRAVHARDKAELGFAATTAVVYNLASAMLIKDAVFLAELATSPEKFARDREKYNVNRTNGDRIVYRYQWHANLQVLGRKIGLHLPLRKWELKLLRHARFARKLLPGFTRQRTRFLADYESLIAGFAYATAQEYAEQTARLSGQQCMSCVNPRCQEEGCPLGSAAPKWVDLALAGEWRQASDLLHETNNFPEFTARICPARCQDKCKRGLDSYPVQIRQFELQIIDRAWREGFIQPQKPTRKTGRKVAVVGSGPAALAAGQQLARAGHQVTVFEKEPLVGGLLRYGVPAHRLAKELIDRRVEQLSAEGVEFRTGVQVGRDVSAKQLRDDFDAVLLATGAARPRDLQIPGRQSRDIVFALDFLRSNMAANRSDAQIRTEDGRHATLTGKHVTIIGGGQTGEDCVEAAIMMGAAQVNQLEILPQPANAAAHAPAHADSVHRRWCVSAREFEVNGHGLSAVKVVNVRWQLTPSGKVMQEIPGSDLTIKTDVAVLAMGFDAVIDPALASELGLATNAKGQAVVRDFATSAPGVFAAGDLAAGSSLVATAIASGRKAAAKIDQYLSGKVEGA